MSKITIKLKKIKIDAAGYHLLVKAMIHNKPVLLVVDTGASQSVLDFHLASKFSDSKPEEVISAISTGVSGEKLKTHLLHVKSFLLGELEIGEKYFVMINLKPVNKSYKMIKRKPVQGILGGDILNDYNAVIDYKKKTMTLSKKNLLK